MRVRRRRRVAPRAGLNPRASFTRGKTKKKCVVSSTEARLVRSRLVVVEVFESSVTRGTV